MKTIKQYSILFYVVLVSLLSIVPYAIMFREGDSESDLGTFILMWMPALAAILHRLLIRQSIFKNVGWNPIKSVKWLAVAMLVPLLISVLGVGLQVAFGFVEFNPAFFTLTNGNVEIHGVAMIFGAKSQPVLMFIGNFLFSFLVGNILYMIVFALGEEYGWRAHLQTMLVEKYSLKYAFIGLGIIWGLWHFPGIWLGHNYPDYPILGGLVVMPITCIALSIVFGFAYIKSKSLWVPVMFHSAINLSSGMDNKMITAKINALGADLVWTGLWITAALIIVYFTANKSK